MKREYNGFYGLTDDVNNKKSLGPIYCHFTEYFEHEYRNKLCTRFNIWMISKSDKQISHSESMLKILTN